MVKMSSGQWRKALFCPPGGHSNKGVMPCENYEYLQMQCISTTAKSNYLNITNIDSLISLQFNSPKVQQQSTEPSKRYHWIQG